MLFPKVLIIGQYFETRTGGGITMGNLFRGWDKDKIAVASEEIIDPDFEVCDNYYQLGSMEIKRRFPFNLNIWGGKIYSGIINKPKTRNNNPQQPFIISKNKSLYLNFLMFTGLIYYKARYRYSNQFSKWVTDFSPDIIYTQLASIELIDFINRFQKKINKPVVIHIMDDWPETICGNAILSNYWREKIIRGFKKLLSNSSALLSISEAMSIEYKRRYGFDFIPFHNPTDLSFWGKSPKEDYTNKPVFSLLYAGRIGTGILTCLNDVAKAIEKFNRKDEKIELIIQNSNAEILIPGLKKYDFVKFKNSVPYEELPQIFSQADALLLPNDFDKKSISYLRYSMPTKASEFMISGSPIFLYAHRDTAISQSALLHKWAFVVNDNNTDVLTLAISEFYHNEELRIRIANTAKNYAVANFASGEVKREFVGVLNGIIKK